MASAIEKTKTGQAQLKKSNAVTGIDVSQSIRPDVEDLVSSGTVYDALFEMLHDIKTAIDVLN